MADEKSGKEKQSKIKKIIVDRPACIGAGSCAVLAAKTFELDEEAKAIIVDEHGDGDKDIIEAAKSCPTDAIILKDTEGNQIWPKTKEE